MVEADGPEQAVPREELERGIAAAAAVVLLLVLLHHEEREELPRLDGPADIRERLLLVGTAVAVPARPDPHAIGGVELAVQRVGPAVPEPAAGVRLRERGGRRRVDRRGHHAERAERGKRSVN